MQRGCAIPHPRTLGWRSGPASSLFHLMPNLIWRCVLDRSADSVVGGRGLGDRDDFREPVGFMQVCRTHVLVPRPGPAVRPFHLRERQRFLGRLHRSPDFSALGEHQQHAPDKPSRRVKLNVLPVKFPTTPQRFHLSKGLACGASPSRARSMAATNVMKHRNCTEDIPAWRSRSATITSGRLAHPGCGAPGRAPRSSSPRSNAVVMAVTARPTSAGDASFSVGPAPLPVSRPIRQPRPTRLSACRNALNNGDSTRRVFKIASEMGPGGARTRDQRIVSSYPVPGHGTRGQLAHP